MRRRHYAIHTERSYCEWVKRYILHFNMQSRDDLGDGSKKIERFLTFLARENIAPATQNQAMNALVFFCKHVLKQTLDESINAERATKAAFSRNQTEIVCIRSSYSPLSCLHQPPHLWYKTLRVLGKQSSLIVGKWQ